MKYCEDCLHFFQTEHSGDAVCRRRISVAGDNMVKRRPETAVPINDLCLIQRRGLSIWRWFAGYRPPNCGYCGPQAKYFLLKPSTTGAAPLAT